jgi:N-acetylneuraminic acid mutarotase
MISSENKNPDKQRIDNSKTMNDIKYHQGKWASKPAMKVARSHGPTAAYNGKIYVFGGGGPDFKSLNSTTIYDPAQDSWSAGTEMPTLRSGAIATTVGDAIYIIGGGFKKPDGNFQFLRTTEIYHPKTDSWEAGPDMFQPHDYPAGALHDNHIYILGGHHPDATLSGPKTDPGFDFCERLNLATGKWEELKPLPTPRFALDAVVMDQKILTMGGVAFTPEGFNNFDHIEAFDPASGEWSLDNLKLPWTAAGLGSIMIDDTPFIFGGYSGDGICDHAACYDKASKTWHLLPPMPAPLAAMGVAHIDRTIYLVGGWADDGRTPLASVIAYTY